jgi:hypothetical protein
MYYLGLISVPVDDGGNAGKDTLSLYCVQNHEAES